MKFTDSYGVTVPLPEGQRITWRVSGYAIVKNNKNQVLMVKSGSGLWHFPGGSIERNETISEGIQRECLEETGYGFNPSSQPLYSNEQFFYHRRDKKFYHSVQLFFAGSLNGESRNTNLITTYDVDRPCSWIALSTLRAGEIHETVRELTDTLACSKEYQ